MLETFSADIGVLILLFLAGIGAFAFSTLAGGGGALLLVPIVQALIGVSGTAPVVNLGTLIGRPVRLYLFWQHIDWRVVCYYAPASVIGAWIAGAIFSQVNLAWLQIGIGLFLISTVFQYRFGQKQRSFPMPIIAFTPLALVVSVASTLVGALGPVLNPFYLNAGLQKEQLIATKTANALLLGLAQLGSYAFFGLLSAQLWLYGLVIGLGAIMGNLLGKQLLGHISAVTFRRLLISFMVVSGCLLLINPLT